MTLTFKENSITLFDTRAGYSFAKDIPVTGDLAKVTEALLAWCNTRLQEGETIRTIVLEQANQISAAATVSCSLGERTFVMLQEELPEELAATLVATWESLKAQPTA